LPTPQHPVLNGDVSGLMSLFWLSQGMEEVPSSEEWLSARELAWLSGMRFPKRRSEFRLGRWTAKNALALYLSRPRGLADLRCITIDRFPDGAPRPFVDSEPALASISMTDRADQAVCVIGPPGPALGCDLEIVEPRSDVFVLDYLTAEEQQVVEEARNDEEKHVLANLIWCGKESALKVLRTGLRRDTRSVVVSFPDAPTQDGWKPLLVRAVEGASFPGWWRRYGEFLLTVTASEPQPPPRPFVDPPGLASAAPAHSWLGSISSTPGKGRA
jgi:4'-phosphopantetheinyl transferase